MRFKLLVYCFSFQFYLIFFSNSREKKLIFAIIKAVELFKYSFFSILVISAIIRVHFHSNKGKE